MKKLILIPGMTLVTILLFSFHQRPKIKLDGAWSIVEVQTVKKDGSSTSTFPIESQVIFSGSYYSFCWTSHSTTLRSWQMSDSMKLLRLNQSIINSGTFELKESVLTTKAAFAMNPMFVNGSATFDCSYRGDTLILTGTNLTSSENIQNPLYAGGSHIINKLIRIGK